MKKTKSFYVSLVFSLLILIIPVVHFVYHKTNGHLVEINNIITDTSLVAFALSILFVLIKKIPNTVKIVITVVILCATSFLCYWLNGVGGYTVFESYNGIEEIESYNEIFEDDYPFRYEDIYKSELDIISYGDFEDIAHYYYFSAGIFQQIGLTTIVEYDDENFKIETEKLKPQVDFYLEKNENTFKYEGFDFILLAQADENNLYPEEINYIGINESTKEIAYVCSMFAIEEDAELLEIDCGWRYVIEERTNK